MNTDLAYYITGNLPSSTEGGSHTTTYERNQVGEALEPCRDGRPGALAIARPVHTISRLCIRLKRDRPYGFSNDAALWKRQPNVGDVSAVRLASAELRA
jgi:hypothetical protein